MVVVPILYWELRRRAPVVVPQPAQTHGEAGDRLVLVPSVPGHVAA
jgi:hypothetical protein